MGTFIALLRGINVSGHKKVGMAELRVFAGELGLENPRTLLNSGNLVFGSSGKTAASLEKYLEAETAKRLGVTTDFLVREAAELSGVIARNPFPDMARNDPGHLVVIFLKSAPDAAAVDALRAAVKGPEVIHVEGRHAYITYPAGIGESKLTNVLIDKKLGARGTGRNWNTILRLARLSISTP